MKTTKILSVLALLVLLFGCSKPAVKTSGEDFNAERSFDKANKLIDSKDYEEARVLLLEVKNRDLTKKYAPLAQLRIADAFIKEGEPDQAVAEYRRFLEIYPDHQHAAYAQYQIAMVYFGQIESPERGYGGALKALGEFEKLKRDFPRNPYKELIDLRMEKCKTVMADYEVVVGQFYLKKKSYSSAIDRFETVMKKFPEYKKEDVVLLKLGIAYRGLGKQDKAEAALRRLIEKYPNSTLLKDAEKELAALAKDVQKK